MNVSLTPELEEFVKKKVESGRYSSASEVMREALRTLEETELIWERRREEVRRKIQVGLDQLDRGESRPADEVFEDLRRMSRERRRKTA